MGLQRVRHNWSTKTFPISRQCIKKQRHYFANKGPHSQSSGFSNSHVWMWELDHKKNKHQRIDAFELWCWRRLLRVPWTARRSNPSILKEINPEYSLEGLMLKLKLQYFGYLMRRSDLLEKTLILGKIEGRKRRGWQRKRWLDGIIDSMDMSLSKFRVMVKGREACVPQSMGLQRIRHHWATEQQQSALHSVSSLSFPSPFLLWASVELTWGKFYINLLNTSIRNAFSMLIRNAFSMLQRNTVFPVILRTWTLMCHSKTFIYQQTWTSSTKVYGQGCAFGIKIWKQIRCP